MSDAVKTFASQFSYQPKIEGGKIKKYDRFALLGMGGSHLAADLALLIDPTLRLTIHSDYGLPPIPPSEIKKTLIIASSYSGNTEEVIDGLNKAHKKNMPLAIIAVGGALIAFAKKKKIPYIQLPDTGIQPRSALGFSLLALLLVIGDGGRLRQARALTKMLRPETMEKAGQSLAKKIQDTVPVIYASRANQAIAYNWKIKLNETGKIPAFCNIVPELNHNEMTGFDVKDASKHLSSIFTFIFLRDPSDHPRNQKRLDTLEKLYRERGLKVERITLEGKNVFEKTFNSLILADWTAIATANIYGLESEQVPMVEEFKELMKQ